VGLVSLIAALRGEPRLPVGLMRWYLGAVVRALHRMAACGAAAIDEIWAAIRGSPVVYADETGLRQDGANGYLWGFGTGRERYFVRGGPTKGIVDAVLGRAFAGALVTDLYAAYDHYDGPHQRCWARLLRDVRALVDKQPADAAPAAWAAQVRAVYDRAGRAASPDPTARRRARRCEADLLAACQPHLDGEPAATPQVVLCRHIAKYLPELFTIRRARGYKGDRPHRRLAWRRRRRQRARMPVRSRPVLGRLHQVNDRVTRPGPGLCCSAGVAAAPQSQLPLWRALPGARREARSDTPANHALRHGGEANA
jgi:hypothetical protein